MEQGIHGSVDFSGPTRSGTASVALSFAPTAENGLRIRNAAGKDRSGLQRRRESGEVLIEAPEPFWPSIIYT